MLGFFADRGEEAMVARAEEVLLVEVDDARAVMEHADEVGEHPPEGEGGNVREAPRRVAVALAALAAVHEVALCAHHAGHAERRAHHAADHQYGELRAQRGGTKGQSKGIEGHGRAWKGMEGHGRAWKGVEGRGRAWKGADEPSAP